jgi:kojibiose phosphorylase
MTTLNPWIVENTRFDGHALGQYNSVFTISNGYLGLKGNLQEDRDGYCPVTLINGVYDELDMFGLIRASGQERRYLDPRYFDTAGRSPAVANLPNPLLMRVFVADREISLSRGRVQNFRQSLDLATSVYRYVYDFQDAAGRTTRIEMMRFAALRHPHRVFMRYAVTPLDYDAPVRVESGVDGAVFSNTTRERQFVIAGASAGAFTGPATHSAGGAAPRISRLEVVTPARTHEVRLGVITTFCAPEHDRTDAGDIIEHDRVFARFAFPAVRGRTYTFDRFVALTCSEDLRHGVVAELDSELGAAFETGFDGAAGEQRAAWTELWERADVQIEGDDRAQQYLRFCIHHVLAAAPRHSDRLSVPVKLLTGEYYQGNTFYDTDVYIVPFYTFAFPRYARTCLNYRFEGLGPAREIARQLGLPGAKLAWQAGPYGEECLGRWWRFTHTNIHINADVAYALVQYFDATGDSEWLAQRGIDILVESARFYAARAVHDPRRDRYDIHDVAGPDEGHCESTNNFYTNYLAARTLRWAAEAVEGAGREGPEDFAAAQRRLALKPDDPQRWRHVADRLTLLFDPATHVYEQCEGYYRLKPIPADLLSERKVWFVTVYPYQALNQPDVVMAMVLFRADFPTEVRRANWNFYKDKSMNFSSISFALNAIMAADMGEMEDAYQNFLVCAGADLDESLTGRKDTYAGLHGTACGGAWMAAIFGFGGVQLSQRGLRIDPNLPPQWKSLRFKLVYRGNVIEVVIDPAHVTLSSAGGGAGDTNLRVGGRSIKLVSGATARIAYRPDVTAL